MFGPHRAAATAGVFAMLAAAAAILLRQQGWMPSAAGLLIYLTLPHALWLGLAIRRYIRQGEACRRIDGLMAKSLSFVLWFGVVPLLDLLSR